jgi:hypothetical protein
MRPVKSLLGEGSSVATVIKHHALKIYEAVVVQLLILLNCQHKMGDVWSVACSGHFTCREISPGTYSVGG